jgi:hypothetical protein
MALKGRPRRFHRGPANARYRYDLVLAQRIEDLAVEQLVAQACSFRIAPVLETGAERYAWLNNILTVGVVRFPPNMVWFSIFEIL